MKRPSIKASLAGLLSLIALAIAVLSLTAFSSLRNLNEHAVDIGEYWMSRMIIAEEVKGNFNLLRLAYSRHLTATTPSELEAEKMSIAESVATVNRLVGEYAAGVRTDKGKALEQAFKQEFLAYVALGEELTDIKTEGQTLVATSFFKGKMKEQAQIATARIDELVSYVSSSATEAVDESARIYETNVILTAGIALLTVTIALGGIVFVVMAVSSPIGRLSSSMLNLAKGNLDTRIPFEGRADEIGTMAGAVEVFRQAGIANKELERVAEEARVRESEQEAHTRQRTAEEAEKLRFATTTLGDGLKRLVVACPLKSGPR